MIWSRFGPTSIVRRITTSCADDSAHAPIRRFPETELALAVPLIVPEQSQKRSLLLCFPILNHLMLHRPSFGLLLLKTERSWLSLYSYPHLSRYCTWNKKLHYFQ